MPKETAVDKESRPMAVTSDGTAAPTHLTNIYLSAMLTNWRPVNPTTPAVFAMAMGPLAPDATAFRTAAKWLTIAASAAATTPLARAATVSRTAVKRTIVAESATARTNALDVTILPTVVKR